MKITDLQIDGFGVWSGLNLNSFAPDITVFYGPNEAGKSTLLQFVRSVCFGYSPERRRFLPPVHGGRAGGALTIAAAHGQFQVSRHEDDPFAATPHGTLRVTAPDGSAQTDAFWRALLSGIDEPTFNNVFAVGLRDVQELNTLSDTDAAQYLYDISAGRDRVSLAEVLRELETSRVRLMGGTAEKPALIAELSQQRDRLQSEIEDFAGRAPRLGRLAAQANGLKAECEQIEAEIGRLQQQLRIYDLAGSLRPKWIERQGIEQQLEALGPVEALPADLLAKLDRLHFRLKKRLKRHARLVGELRIAQGESSAIKIDEALIKQAPRIEVLAEQIPFTQALEKQITTLEEELDELEHRHHARKQQLGVSSHAPTATAALLAAASSIATSGSAASSAQASNALGLRAGWSYFSPTAARLRDARRRHQEAQEELGRHKDKATEVKTQVSSKLGTRSPADITSELEKTGTLVTQLRRRIQLDDNLKQLGLQKSELDNHVEAALEEILLPPQVLFGLGGLFVFGVVLILAGLFFPASLTGRVGWWLALLGLAGTAISGTIKWFFEHKADHHVDNCSRQLETLNEQIQEAETERDQLDAQLPKGGGALAARLQTAEAQLSSLQELLPLHSHKESTEHHARSVEDQARRAAEEYHKTKQRWRKLLRAAGLEEGLSPADVAQRTREEEQRAHSHQQQQLATEREQQKQALEHAAKREHLSGVEQLIQTKREEIGNRRREHEAVTARIKQLLSDAGLLAGSRHPFEQLVQLRRDVDEQRALLARRRALHRRRKALRQDVAKMATQIKRLRHVRGKLLKESGVKNIAEVRRRTANFNRFEQLRKQRDLLTLDIANALAGAFPEAALHEHLDANPQTFEARRTEGAQRLEAAQQRFAALLQQRGELAAQSRTLLEDRRLQNQQLELSCIEKKLSDAIERWQVLATTTGLLEHTRREFETERQPETLREASDYFERLTEGRYRRVWTPLGEPILRVDDSEGHTLPVEKLSCGTREQLFLSLRLALAALYSRRGANLPLVLDDVLVNYDTHRARAAAQVLKDFAAKGHQLLVFTCHEHILDLFAELGVDARYLPINGNAERNGLADRTIAPVAAPKRRGKKERALKREPQPPQPELELAADEPLEPAPPVEPARPHPPAPVAPAVQPIVRVERLQPAHVPAPFAVAAGPSPRKMEPARRAPVPPRRRIDPPQERSALYLQRAKWSAEEFDGELEDWVAVRGRVEEQPVRPVVAPPTASVIAVRQGFAPEIVVEKKEIAAPGRMTGVSVTPLADDDYFGIA
ncbi:MAG TPA: AAA family ATPase [Pirellulales bacterium]|nr:AAA family ATPase [Pirellulales bacterium]